MSRRLAIIEGQRLALAYGQTDPSLWRRCQQLAQTVAEQAARISTLEAQRTPDPLAHVNDARRAESERLRGALAAVLAQDSRPQAITAKQALRALERAGWGSLPSVRTMQRHLDALRHTTCGVRNDTASRQKL